MAALTEICKRVVALHQARGDLGAGTRVEQREFGLAFVLRPTSVAVHATQHQVRPCEREVGIDATRDQVIHFRGTKWRGRFAEIALAEEVTLQRKQHVVVVP